ncbi:EamA family transporter [Patescibacteria group bacterium]|nr:EamA family transporter [Patescibacteria group bacterium]MBU1916379.1 EamA family transporter [Patescibacteria group bacterium]
MEYVSIILAQLLYTASDVWKKAIFNVHGFNAGVFIKPVFIFALLIAGAGFLFQMHALSRIDLSRTIIIMGMLAVIFSAGAGAIFFREQFNYWNLAGILFALIAIIFVNIR